jgi:hypothetical protein
MPFGSTLTAIVKPQIEVVLNCALSIFQIQYKKKTLYYSSFTDFRVTSEVQITRDGELAYARRIRRFDKPTSKPGPPIEMRRDGSR